MWEGGRFFYVAETLFLDMLIYNSLTTMSYKKLFTNNCSRALYPMQEKNSLIQQQITLQDKHQKLVI